MSSLYSTSLKIELIGTGDQTGIWGGTTNTNLGTAIEQAIVGRSALVTGDFTANVATLTLTDTNASQTARAFVLDVTATLSAAGTINVPAVQKPYIVFNNTVGGFAITIKVSGLTGVSIPNGRKAIVYNNGTDIGDAVTYLSSLTLGSALPVLSGGTGVTTSTGTGSVVLSTSPTLVTPALGTPSALVGTNITGTAAGLTAGNVTTNANLTGAVTSVGNATSLGSFSSANLAGALTDETGSGSAVFATSPTLVTPILGTPQSVTLTNGTGLPISTGVSGLGTGVATALGINVGTAGSPVVNGGALGTPSSGTVTNLTGTANININGTVGATTPAAGNFTTLNIPSTGTASNYGFQMVNTGGTAYVGIDGSTGSITGIPYSTALVGTSSFPVILRVNTINVAVASTTGLAVTGTLSATGGVTLSGGTANGVAYLNGSKVLTTGTALTFDGGANLSTGGSNASTYNTLNVNNTASNGYSRLFFNIGTSGANGVGVIKYAPGIFFGIGTQSDASSTPMTFLLNDVEQMRLTSTGLGIGTTSPAVKFVVSNGGLNGYEFDPANNFISSYNRNTSAWTTITFRAGGYVWNINNSTDALKLDASGNLGLGVTPNIWNSGPTLQASRASFAGSTSALNIGLNAYFNSGFKYIAAATASLYQQQVGQHIWYNAPSGTAGAAISFTQAMTLDASGNLLVGTTALDTSNLSGFIAQKYAGGVFTDLGHNTSANSGDAFSLYRYNGSIIGSITQNGTTGVLYNTSSDYRLKDITGPITTSGAYIDSLNPVEGTWKADGRTFVGLIAHEVQEASRTTVATGTKDGEQMQGMDYSSAEIIANLIAELQSLRARVAQLESKP